MSRCVRERSSPSARLPLVVGRLRRRRRATSIHGRAGMDRAAARRCVEMAQGGGRPLDPAPRRRGQRRPATSTTTPRPVIVASRTSAVHAAAVVGVRATTRNAIAARGADADLAAPHPVVAGDDDEVGAAVGSSSPRRRASRCPTGSVGSVEASPRSAHMRPGATTTRWSAPRAVVVDVDQRGVGAGRASGPTSAAGVAPGRTATDSRAEREPGAGRVVLEVADQTLQRPDRPRAAASSASTSASAASSGRWRRPANGIALASDREPCRAATASGRPSTASTRPAVGPASSASSGRSRRGDADRRARRAERRG